VGKTFGVPAAAKIYRLNPGFSQLSGLTNLAPAWCRRYCYILIYPFLAKVAVSNSLHNRRKYIWTTISSTATHQIQLLVRSGQGPLLRPDRTTGLPLLGKRSPWCAIPLPCLPNALRSYLQAVGFSPAGQVAPWRLRLWMFVRSPGIDDPRTIFQQSLSVHYGSILHQLQRQGQCRGVWSFPVSLQYTMASPPRSRL